MVTRREFLDTLAVGTAGLAIASSAKSYGQIMGANERLNFAVIGLNSRAYAHLSALHANKDAACIGYVCDVESNILAKFAAKTEQQMGTAPKTEKDFRKILEKTDVDAVTIATPDHWHAPMAIAGAPGRQACLRGKALQPQPRGRRDARQGAGEAQQAGADGQPAALLAAHHRDREEDS